MRAAVFDGELSVQDRPEPERSTGEALIRVTLAGICNTDVEILRGYMDFTGILGHEFVGVVAECDEAAWTGRRVVGEINLPCRSCDLCAKGLGKHCRNRTVLGIAGKDGAFAEFVTLPVEDLHAVPDGVRDQQAVFTEPLAACFEMLERGIVGPDDRVVVLGDGKMGALACAVMATVSGDVTLLGKHPEKLNRITPPGVRTALVGESGACNFDVAVECTGSPRGLSDAVRLVHPRGIIFLKSTVSEGIPLNLSPVVVDEITIVGSRCGPFEPALAALARGDVKVDHLVDAIFPVEEALAAFDEAQRPGVMKVLLDLSGGYT